MALGLFDYEKVNNRLIKALQEEPALQDLLQAITYRKVRSYCSFTSPFDFRLKFIHSKYFSREIWRLWKIHCGLPRAFLSFLSSWRTT